MNYLSFAAAARAEIALCFEKWKTQDETAAKRWLEITATLNQEAKQRLLAK
jgi:hypothetical protein